MVNQVILIGRMASDVELRYTPAGIPTASVKLAVNRDYKKEGAEQSEADFIPLVLWRQSAEFAANYLGKGRLCYVQGKLQIRSWDDQQSGQKRWMTEVVVDNLKALDRPKEDQAGGDSHQG